MSDLSITAANVLASGGAKTVDAILGGTQTAGQIVYIEAASGTTKPCDCDSATAEARSPKGFLLNGGGAGQPCKILTSGPITLGAVLTVGVTYYLSPGSAGGLCAVADVLSGDYPVIMGVARSTSVLDVKIHEAGVAL